MMQCNQAEYVIKQHVCQALDQVILNYALSYDCRKSNYGTFLEFNEKIHIYVGWALWFVKYVCSNKLKKENFGCKGLIKMTSIVLCSEHHIL